MQAILDFIAALVVSLAAAALSQFGGEVRPAARDAEPQVHRVSHQPKKVTAAERALAPAGGEPCPSRTAGLHWNRAA